MSSSSVVHRVTELVPGRSSPARPSRSPSAGRAAGRSSRDRAADRLGTAGWAGKGVLYLVIAVLALQLASTGGASSEQASKQGALQALVDEPFGSVAVAVVVAGLLAYAAYRLLAVFLPRSSSGGAGGQDKAKATGHRLVHLGSAAAYGAFGAQGVALLLGRGDGGGGEATRQTWSAVLMSSTPGTVLLVAVGLGFLAFAGWQVRKAVTRSFLDKLSCPPGGFPDRRVATWTGVTGLAARGVVAALVGIFVLVSVWRHDPSEVRGLDGALRSLLGAPAGPPLLMAVALGLAAYGVYALVCARCRRHELG